MMDLRVISSLLLAAGLLCLTLAPAAQTEDLIEDGLGDVDVEVDEMDLGMAVADDDEEELDVETQVAALPAPKVSERN